MLHWVGKRPLETASSFPAQLVEEFVPTHEQNNSNLLFHGDNKEVLGFLLTNGYRGAIDFIYIDPPFDSKADYVRNVTLRGIAVPLKGEGQTLIEQTQYSDIWANDTYLQFMYERLLLMRELLAGTGTICLHCDDTKSHLLRCVLDEVFGEKNFLNEIIHCYGEREKIQRSFNRKHQTIFWYAKDSSSEYTFNPEDIREEFAKTTIGKYKYEDEDGRFRIRGMNREEAGHLRAKTDISLEDESEFTYRDYLESREGPAPRDWFVKPFLNQAANERENYPTQKNPAVPRRFVLGCTKPGDLVLDCFIGSGTTAAVAQKLGRRWIGCDINKGAVQTTSKRLQNVIKGQLKASKQQKLPTQDEIAPIYSFKHYRINDYDLQIQHNEALELALEFVGVVPKRSDSFFEGELGKELVKVVPFTHPCTMLDIELVKNELKNRPNEDRNIAIISLGKDANIDAELAEYNKRAAINKIRLIDLRTDPKHGKFLVHEPAWADITVKNTTDGKATVTIDEFMSPTIIKRLELDETIFREKVTDFRSMIDVVLIDTSYNGEVFNICYSDVPAKKNDLVEAKYVVDVPKGSKRLAVKVIDMLGEEVLQTIDINR